MFVTHHDDGCPRRGVVLTGVNADVPARLKHVNDRLHADVELWQPCHLHTTLRIFQKTHLPARFQGNTWKTKIGKNERLIWRCQGVLMESHLGFSEWNAIQNEPRFNKSRGEAAHPTNLIFIFTYRLFWDFKIKEFGFKTLKQEILCNKALFAMQLHKHHVGCCSLLLPLGGAGRGLWTL